MKQRPKEHLNFIEPLHTKGWIGLGCSLLVLLRDSVDTNDAPAAAEGLTPEGNQNNGRFGAPNIEDTGREMRYFNTTPMVITARLSGGLGLHL